MLAVPFRFAMQITCPNCATSYDVEAASLGGQGRSVRCARCSNVWFAVAPPEPAEAWSILDEPAPSAPVIIHAAPSEYAEAPGQDDHAVPAEEPAATESGSTEGIDVAGLNAEMDAERAEQEAEADAVLAEVTAQIAPGDLGPVPVPVPAAAEPQPAAAESQPGIAATVGEDVETAAARRMRHERLRRQKWRRSALSAAVVALMAANAVLITWRSDIVRLLPQTAALYSAIGLAVNLRGLEFDDIRMSRAEQDGVNVLVVEGAIVNVTRRAVEVPRLRLAVRNDGKNEVYAWTARPARSILGPGEALSFRSRLASPPSDAREVEVRFLSKRDLVAGLN